MADTAEFQAAVLEARAEDHDKPIPLTFKGETFHGRVPGGLAFMEFIAAGDLDTESTDQAEVIEANRAVLEFLQSLIVEEDWRRFRRLCRRQAVSATELGALIREWLSVMVGRPTQQQPPSLGEPSANGGSSRVAATVTE